MSNSAQGKAQGDVVCDENGDIDYQLIASGAGTLQVAVCRYNAIQT